VQVEAFSSLKKQGVDKLRQKLDSWFNELEPAEAKEEYRSAAMSALFLSFSPQ
jgi:hypothetical protein